MNSVRRTTAFNTRRRGPVRVAVAARVLLLVVAVAWSRVTAADDAPAVSYAKQIAPLLAENCYYCHGPDPSHREGDLRLDVWEGADDGAATASAVIVPGDPDGSELVARITSDDPDVRMPPVDSGKKLDPHEIELLREWVRQGARFERHWGFIKPARPPVPTVKRAGWVRNPLDAFVLSRLEREAVEPSTAASAATLLRRASLDATGLPPTLEEIATFNAEAKSSVDRAYTTLVDRLLASPQHAERVARDWLDAARYADSDGYEKDRPRDVWMYRDWVVDALARDIPYDEFVVRQVAGDLLPHATQADRVATGFLRNSMVNREGGIDPEQFRMEAMFDRIDAIGKSMVGLTFQCAQCHSHKFDPLTQSEYYGLLAALNNCHESQIAVYTVAEQQAIDAVHAEIKAIESTLKEATPAWRTQVDQWAKALAARQPQWLVLRPSLDGSGGQKHSLQADGSVLAEGYAPPQLTATFEASLDAGDYHAVRLELLTNPNLPLGGPGRAETGICSLAEIRLALAPDDSPERKTDLKFAAAYADVNPPQATLPRQADDGDKPDRTTGPVALAIDGDELTAWSIDVGPGRTNVPRQAVFTLAQPLHVDRPMKLFVTLAQRHGGRAFDSASTQNIGCFRLSAATTPYAADAMFPAELAGSLAADDATRTPAQLDALFSAWRITKNSWQESNQHIEAIWRRHPRGSSQLVVQEREAPRTTYRLERGNFLAPAEKVAPSTPAFLHAPDDNNPATPARLRFARWLASRESPTAARAIVNRIWQQYFGVGLSTTPDDFGLQGDVPSHPELLDWLAVELMDHDWSLRHIHRLILTSATYRQASNLSADMAARDPQNRLLARGPRSRLSAEGVQDAVLAASGLLSGTVGGPPSFPPAPQFMFEQPASYEPKTWPEDSGERRYRRGLYVFRYRTALDPVLETFDAPPANVACVRRPSSNSPMQALTLLNETLMGECARALADRTLAAPAGDASRIDAAFARCTSRFPTPEEAQTLIAFLTAQRARFSTDPKTAATLGATDPDANSSEASPADVAERASWIALSRVLLNLDETISKN